VTTKQLAVYMVTGLAVVVGLGGLVPPLVNAPDTLLNALGVGVTLAVIGAAALVAHATYTKKDGRK
jgi:hypothetical protein